MKQGREDHPAQRVKRVSASPRAQVTTAGADNHRGSRCPATPRNVGRAGRPGPRCLRFRPVIVEGSGHAGQCGCGARWRLPRRLVFPGPGAGWSSHATDGRRPRPSPEPVGEAPPASPVEAKPSRLGPSPRRRPRPSAQAVGRAAAPDELDPLRKARKRRRRSRASVRSEYAQKDCSRGDPERRRRYRPTAAAPPTT